MKYRLLFLALLAAPLAPAWAGGKAMHDGMSMPATDVHGMAVATAEGVVRKVDREAGKVTLRHGAIESLNMPPMTMVYRVSRPALMDGIKAGDRVRFELETRDGMSVLTRIERLP